jgi:hypothetical protein
VTYNTLESYNTHGKVKASNGQAFGKERREFDPSKYSHTHSILVSKGIY